MYVLNGIAYAGEPTPALRVCGVRPLDDFRLWVRFNNDEARIYDFKPLLGFPAFAPLANPDTFKSVYIDYGVTVWNDGDIDIAPEEIYEKGLPCWE
jgi:hypothetical protein